MTTQATCTAEGERTGVCTVCGYTKTESIPMTGHDWGVWRDNGDGTHSQICSNDPSHTQNSGAHTYGAWVVTTPATCTANGAQTAICSVCQGTKTESIPMTGHTPGSAVSNNDGTHSIQCTVCQQEISSEACTYGDWTVTTPATCTTDGVKTATCSVCQGTKTESIPMTGHTPGSAVSNNDGTHSVHCMVCRQELSSDPCTYGDWTVTTQATCTTDGVKTATCSVCQGTKTESIPMTGHNYGGWTETTPATCTTDGSEQRVCSHDSAHVETRTVPATGHDWGDWRDNGDGTHSQICKHDPSHTQENGAHTYGEWTVTKAPTAGEAGSKERSCDKCGHKETEEIPATGGPAVNPNPGGGGGGSSVKPNPDKDKPDPDKDKPDPGEDKPVPDDSKPDKPVFDDVPETAFYAAPVNWAVEKGITRGTSDVTFSPNQPCSRKEIVTFLWRAAGSPEPKATVNPFSDVEKGTYYAKAVLWAFENGITTGSTATTFAPDASCTRWQVVTFLWRAKDKPEASAAGQFSDVESSAFYAQAVAWAVDAGVTKGTSEATFAPNDICSRSQIVTFLYRAYK